MQFNRIMSHGHVVRQAANCVCAIQFATCTGKTKTHLTDQFIPYKTKTRSVIHRFASILLRKQTCVFFAQSTVCDLVNTEHYTRKREITGDSLNDRVNVCLSMAAKIPRHLANICAHIHTAHMYRKFRIVFVYL